VAVTLGESIGRVPFWGITEQDQLLTWWNPAKRGTHPNLFTHLPKMAEINMMRRSVQM
jgi:hypothetical protein